MPYLYSAVREAHETGMPIIRALWLHYPDDREAVARGDEYLWGRDMLVAPVVEKGATSRDVYLPARPLVRLLERERASTAAARSSRAVDLATMPLYVRAGAVLPLGPVKQYTERAGRRAADAVRSIPAPTARSRCTKTTGRRSTTAEGHGWGSRCAGRTRGGC